MHDHSLMLSIVAVSRNDDHGGDMLGRMQHFVDGFIAQCKRHDLSAELILVEWNPPADRPPLAQALAWPDDFGPAEVRIVTVPRELHANFENADKLLLFQMIGKNVGIRRAHAPFVLATNVDILFNDQIFEHMRNGLKRGTVLRVDRFDVPKDLPRGIPFSDVLAYCDGSLYHVGTRLGMYDAMTGEFLGAGHVLFRRLLGAYYRMRLKSPAISFGSMPWRELARALAKTAGVSLTEAARVTAFLVSKLWPPQRIPMRAYRLVLRIGRLSLRLLRILLQATVATALRPALRWHLLPRRLTPRYRRRTAAMRLFKLHTFACGDFTLMARDDWFRLRGYAEWPIYSWHIDSVLMYAASALGVRQIALSPAYRIYHIEQTPGSGWSPDAAAKLFSRLDAAGIPYLTDQQLRELGLQFLNDPASAIINDDGWGLGQHDLPEVHIAPGGEPMIETARAAG